MLRTGTQGGLVSLRMLGKVCLVAFAACATGASHPSAAQTDSPVLGQSFVLKAGESAVLRDTKVRVRFESVLEDSRCPEGEQCVWAGNARVLLQIAPDGGTETPVELNTNKGAREATVQNLHVTLAKVEPYPSSRQAIAPGDYRATISLNRVEN